MRIHIILLILLSFSTSLFSQSKSGIGNVSDKTSGTLIPNARVQISPSSDTSVVYNYICDKNGNYSFDIASNDSIFFLNIFPSEKTLQFSHIKETIALSNGNNGVLYYNVNLTGSKGLKFTVTDTSGIPVSGAKVTLFSTQSSQKADSCRIAKAVYTDDLGTININSLLPIKYWFNIRKGYMTNAFTIDSTINAIDTNNITNITVAIRDLKLNEFRMCGLCDNKTWVTDSMILFGITMPYDADTKLLSDATWWDSNGRFGYWWFNEDETIMTYNYKDGTAGGSLVDATNLTITDSTWVGDMEFNGLPVTYFMSVHYPDTINLTISARDTTIYLDKNGKATISADDLFMIKSYCFTCNTTLSQNSFNSSDIGNNEVYVTMEDRCGNMATDTLVVTVAANLDAIDEIKESNIIVFPNPASNFILINSKNDRIQQVTIYNINGTIIKHFKANTKQFSCNISNLKKGYYIIKVYTTSDVVTKKIVLE